jgi:hypothetical protein
MMSPVLSKDPPQVNGEVDIRTAYMPGLGICQSEQAGSVIIS